MPVSNRSLKITVVLLAVLLGGSSFLLYNSFEKANLQDKTIGDLENLSENQKAELSQLEISIASLEQNLSAKEEQLKNETKNRQALEKELINLTAVARSQYGVLAVDVNNNGHFIPLEVIIKSGSGNLLLNVANVLIDETTQSSAQIAVRVARDITRTSLTDKDILINIENPAPEQQLSIAGGSGGAAMTLAAMAAMQGKTIRKDVLITGTINDDHSIGKIGGARAKAFAAKENGAVIFLVPVGQKSDVGDVGIEVREVGTIEEAARYAIPS